MQTTSPSRTAQLAWQDVQSIADSTTRQRVEAIVSAQADTLSDLFYRAMFADPESARLLDHALVNQRLHASMARWLRGIFAQAVDDTDKIAMQQRTGEVHARIGVPIRLVETGARVLKRAIAERLAQAELAGRALTSAVQYVYELVDLAIELMNATYASNADRMARTDEAYRLFFLSQDMKAERERQKSRLLEWAHQILMRFYWGEGGETASALPAGLASSQFGLWLQHKAAMLFEGAPEIAQIQSHVARIEADLLPHLAEARRSHEDSRAVFGAISGHIDAIKQLLGSMFDRYIDVDDGRDSVTRLLNRRYFASVAKREIALAQQHGSGFALLMIDIDGFRQVGQVLGLEGADLVLSQVAGVLLDSVRAGDFVFRIGDDQFLVLLVEAPADAVLAVAEGLRERVAATSLRTPGAVTTSVTVSIGAAVFDGHPDYQRLLDRADEALRSARQLGRNRCVLLPAPSAA